jgi:hypothetical protein
MKITRLLACLLLPLGLGLAASAASVPFDQWADSFAADWVRADPSGATVTQYFSGAEQDALDRRLTPTTKAYRESRVARAKEGLAALAPSTRTPSAPASASRPTCCGGS